MQYTRLGSTGLSVSRIALGCMSYGSKQWRNWVLEEEDALPHFRRAVELGINFFDTADVYSIGVSEEITGKALREFARLDEVVLATKVRLRMGDGPNKVGLSRKHIIQSCEASLKRLGVEKIDLYQIHRWDYDTPVEETLEALHDVVKAGKVLYLGASSMFAWQFTELQMTAEKHGWTKFISMQNHYNLIYREEEREMNPYCASHGVGITPWSPLARGILTGAYKGGFDQGTTARSTGGDRRRTESLYRGEMDFAIADRVGEVAQKYEKAPAQIALAWMMNKPEITAPIVGVSKIEQLDQLVAAAEISLAEEDVTYLEELYKPVVNLLSIGTS